MELQLLKNACKNIQYGFTASAIDEVTDAKFLRITDIQGGVVDWKKVPYCKIDEGSKSKYLLNFGDIVVARTGNSTGENFIFESSQDAVFASYLIRFQINEDFDPKYIWYCMRSKSWKHFIEGFKTGSAQMGANANTLGQFRFPLHPLKTQKNISNFLSTLDKKIELNQKMNEILEEIAKTLFKSWFIDFDPVRAKEEGRSTGLPKVICDLFPDSFEDSELGEIPSGWKVENIGNSFEVLLGGTPSRKKEEYWDGDIPWINSGEINNFRVVRPSEFISDKGFKNSSTKLLPKRSTLIAITGATLGQVSLNEIEVCANQSVIGIPPSKNVMPEYVYLWICFSIQKLISSQTGGAQQHINTNNVREHLILLPTAECNDYLKNLLTPVFNKISNNLFEIQTLSEIRDTLLPKLISGELKIPDAENLVEEAGI